MIIKNIRLQKFRCFKDFEIPITQSHIVIHGNNGQGKSSILEALHYSCYLRSFRTHLNRELATIGERHFFIEIQADQINDQISDTIKVGFSHETGKQVLLNGKLIQSYKQLIDHYRIVTLSAEDTALVQGAPEERRQFLNYSLCLHNSSNINLLKEYKQVAAHRSALIQKMGEASHFHGSTDEIEVWSSKLWDISHKIRLQRVDYLQSLEQKIRELLELHFHYDAQTHFSIDYHRRGGDYEDFESFWRAWTEKSLRQEYAFGRTLFGAQLDDFSLSFHHKKARMFASRGQQKLLTLLLKIAQIDYTNRSGEPGILLLDDFITDFDKERVERCLALITSLQCQVFFTSPIESDTITKRIDAQRIDL